MSEARTKRTDVYRNPPSHFGIDPCPKCGTAPDWSEWEGLLWCSACEVDYKAEYWGILDGPTLANVVILMGFDFERVTL